MWWGWGRRPPAEFERKEVFELWSQRGLNASAFTGGSLVAFIKQLKKLLG
jgi:hypothetical protein